MANVLTLQGIKRWYGAGEAQVSVLKNVDLTIETGQAVAIVGPSGSGKSTLLHVAGLLDAPDSGRVELAGRVVFEDGAKRLQDDIIAGLRNRSCGFVYQFHHLLREFTALENVLMPARILGGTVDVARAQKLLKAVGLEPRLGHLPQQLSGGEQQRVALARALMNKPKLLLADEPTGNLDPHTAEEVVELMFGMVRREGMSALIVTHNMDLARQCDRVLTMREGRLVDDV